MQVIVFLVVGGLVAALAYHEAGKFESETGQAAWGLSPALWALVVFVTGLFVGGILLCVARRSTKRQMRREALAAPKAPQSPDPLGTAPVGSGYMHPGGATILPSFD